MVVKRYTNIIHNSSYAKGCSLIIFLWYFQIYFKYSICIFNADDTVQRYDGLADCDHPHDEVHLPAYSQHGFVLPRLIELGWLDADQRAGEFDNTTLLALVDFQCYMNSINKDVMLPTNGYPDDLTMTWLRWTNAPSRPAVIESTPEPPLDEIMLSADSSEEDISAFKQKLSQLGWLDAGADINGLYDEALTEAVTQLKFWLLDNWDETLYGERPEWTEISGGFVDWQTMRVVIDETNPPMKPAGYDPW